MFGEGFKHEDSMEQLPEGNYTATIKKAEIKDGNYGSYIQAEVEIEGHPNCNPHIFLLNDSPKSGYGKLTKEEALKMWNRKMTLFFASFGIAEGNFSVETWVGKKGEITVQQQKKNPQYNEIIPYKTTPKKAEKKETSAPSSSSTDFPEDIPEEVGAIF